VFLVFCPFKAVLHLFVPPPGREVSPLNLDVCFIDYENMVDAVVQENPVMRNQNKPMFSLQIIAQGFSAQSVKMIRRLINQQKAVFFQEQSGKQCFCLLPL